MTKIVTIAGACGVVAGLTLGSVYWLPQLRRAQEAVRTAYDERTKAEVVGKQVDDLQARLERTESVLRAERELRWRLQMAVSEAGVPVHPAR